MTPLLVIAILVSLVGAAIFFRAVGLLGCCLAVIVVSGVFGHPFFHRDVGPFPVTLDRLLLGCLVVVFLAARRLGGTPIRSINLQDWLLVGFLSILAIGTLGHDWRVDHARPLASLLFFYLLPACMYLVVREVPISVGRVRSVYVAFAVFACYLGLTAICEYQQWTGWILPSYIHSSRLTEFLGRRRGPFLNPAANGLYLCTGLICLVVLWNRATRRGKCVIAGAILIVATGVFCTLTRCVWLAAAGALWVLVLSRLNWRQGITATALVALSGAALVALNWHSLNSFKRDQNVSVSDMSRSTSLRPILAHVAFDMIRERPIWGFGLGQYVPESRQYLSDRSTHWPLERVRDYEQHNIFLSLLVEAGIVGSCLYLLFLLAWCQAAWQIRGETNATCQWQSSGWVVLAIVSAYLTIGMFQDLAIVRTVNLLVFFWAGLTRNIHSARQSSPCATATRRTLGQRTESADLPIARPVVARHGA